MPSPPLLGGGAAVPDHHLMRGVSNGAAKSACDNCKDLPQSCALKEWTSCYRIIA
jgi:hypothetical protein